MAMPWDLVIPPEDIAAFDGVFGPEVRPLDAGDRPALLIVDMTLEFADSAYPTGWSPTGWPAVAATKGVLDAARAAHVPVVFTRKGLVPGVTPPSAERGRWRRHPDRPPVDPGLPFGDTIVDDLKPRLDEVVIEKGSRPSAFFGTPLVSYLNFHQIDTLIITGMVTSGCVRASVLDAFQYNYKILIPHECVADRSQISHAVSLFDMHMKYADVVPVATALDYVARCS